MESKPKIIVPCRWLMVGKSYKCCVLSSPNVNYCAFHHFKIKSGKSVPVECKRCKKGTKTSISLCTNCAKAVKVKPLSR